MSRWISFVVLLGVIVVIAAFFIRVMAEFLVPLFVATLLVVIFRPVHLWYLKKTNDRPAWSALLTTTTVILAVVLPFGLMLALAAAEGREIVKRFDKSQILQKLDDFRSTFGLNVKHLDQLTTVEERLNGIRISTQSAAGDQPLLSPKHFSAIERNELYVLLAKTLEESERLGVEHQMQWPPEVVPKSIDADEEGNETESSEADAKESEENGEANQPTASVSDGPGVDSSSVPANPSEDSTTAIRDTADSADNGSQLPTDTESEENVDEANEEKSTSFLQMPFSAFTGDEEEDDGRPSGSTALEQLWFDYVYQVRDTQRLVEDKTWSDDVTENRELEWQLRAAIADCHAKFREFKVQLLGGPLVAWLKELVNPQDDDIQQYADTGFALIQENFLSWGGTATVFLGRMIFGGVIVLVSVYFFLLDGPAMMASVMQLSPMDDRHEKELINEFERVSRAVVLATLVAAVAQGILAGLGFYIAGIQSVFLLTMLTMLLAMIPFFGATSVWLPVVLYVGFFENRIIAASFLFLYCALIVSTIDNIIKPYILHGQSNLHPLLALLSVLGGVTALGAIGIMVGPMLVAFLQTLLKILRDELVTLDDSFQLATDAGTGVLLPGQGSPPAMDQRSSSGGTKSDGKSDVSDEGVVAAASNAVKDDSKADANDNDSSSNQGTSSKSVTKRRRKKKG